MPYSTKAILVDANGKPIPQYFDPVADAYQPLYGRNGATRVELYDASGNPITVDSGKLAVRATELEALLDGVESALGTQADAEATGDGSLIAIVKRLRTILSDVWADAANALQVQQVGQHVQPTLRTITTTPLGAGQMYTAPDLDLEAPPGIAALAYSVVSDTPVRLQFMARGVPGGQWFQVASVTLLSSAANYPIFIPPFKPLGRRWVVRVVNPTSTAQTSLEVYEHQFTSAQIHPQNIRALLAYNLAIRDTNSHTHNTDPGNAFIFRRIPFGGGKVPIYVDNQLDQAVDVTIYLSVADRMSAALGTITVPASSKRVITNMDFAGLDVPSEEIYCAFRCSTAPTTGVVNAWIDSLVGGSA